MKQNRVLVCSTCTLDKVGAQVATSNVFRAQIVEAMRDAGLEHQFEVDGVACMGACEAPVAIAIQGHGRGTYLFAGVDPEADLTDIVSTCRTYLEAPQGWIEDARPCGRLRELLRSRVPAMDSD
ncbi:MAG: DUF1636 family protein [Pseudomonadota bacterium]